MSRKSFSLPTPQTPSLQTLGQTKLASTSASPPASLAPGFRFHPTDEELIIYYLKRKVLRKTFRFDAISEVDIYGIEPWDLAAKSRLKTKDQEWYFFSALDKKYGNGARMNRATTKGYWKATGNDRPIWHDQRNVGYKKTLVFHSGRAPDGKRTNWVMHEYRIVDEELDRDGDGITQVEKDAYVLCRVIHKNNIGPPNGQRYARFVEEEWNDVSTTAQGTEVGDEVPYVHHQCAEGDGWVACFEDDNVVQESQYDKKAQFDVNKLLIETQGLLTICKTERMEESALPKLDNSKDLLFVNEYTSMQRNNPKPISMYKRKRYNNSNLNHWNVADDSFQFGLSPCSETTNTTATIAPTIDNIKSRKHFLSALVEHSLQETSEQNANSSVLPLEFDFANLDSSESSSCAKFIQHLQSEIEKLNDERKTMKFELVSAQAVNKILQSRIDLLNIENEELKRRTHQDV